MRHDVPAAIAEAEAASGLQLTLAKGIGTGEDLADILAEHTRLHGEGLFPPTPKLCSTPSDPRLPVRMNRSSAWRNRWQRNCNCTPKTSPLCPPPASTAPGVVTQLQPDLVVPLFFSPATLLDRLRHYLENRMPQSLYAGAAPRHRHRPLVLARAEQAQLTTAV